MNKFIRLILAATFLFTSLGATASSFTNRGIPIGDKFRTSGAVSVTTAVETTVLTVASGGGLIHGIHFDINGRQQLDNIKVTVDGAAERTLTYGVYPVYDITTPYFLPLPIAFATSITIKVNMTISVGSPKNVVVEYSVL